ncbi:MAG: nucleoside-diphosphate kinase [Bacteroidota bacterium]
MKGTTTLTIIKPTAMKKHYHTEILREITDYGFNIKALKMIQMTRPQAERFYEIHKGKPFFQNLVDFMCSGPVIVAILEARNAVKAYRRFIGATNPEKAEDKTLRHKYGSSLTENAVHGSDSDENAEKEAAFFFSGTEVFDY